MKNVFLYPNVNHRAILFAACTFLILVLGSIFAVTTLRSVIAKKDNVVFEYTETLLDVERLAIAAEKKVSASRGYLLNPDEVMYESMLKARGDFLISINELKEKVRTPIGRKYIAQIENAEKKHQDVLDSILLMKQKDAPLEIVVRDFRRLLLPRSIELNKALENFEEFKHARLKEMRNKSVETDTEAMRVIYLVSILSLLLIPVMIFYLYKLLIKRRSKNLEVLKHSEERLGLAIKFSGMGIWDWRIKEKILIWNENTEAIFDYPPGAFTHPFTDFEERLHPEDKDAVANTLQEAINNNSEFRSEYRIVTSKGTKWIISLGKAVYDDNNSACRMVGIVIDISDRKLFEKKLQASVRAREEVLAIVSHDLRNPLGVMLMSAGMIERRVKDTSKDEWIRGQAEKIKKSGQRMNDLIEDLLSLTKIEAGHFTLNKKYQSVNALLNEVLENTKALSAEKNLRVEMDFSQPDIELELDHNQMLRVFGNIISNGIKFSPLDGIIRISAHYTEGDVIFDVTDSGPGIAEHHLTNVFDRFWQAQGTAHKGTGLGLAIAKGITEAHGGQIWVKSKFGEGATFSFSIPRQLTS